MFSLFGFSDRNKTLTDVYAYDYERGSTVGERANQIMNTVGGRNWSADVRREQAQPRAELADGRELQSGLRQSYRQPGRAHRAAG
ncbi:hypothetical protein G6F50_018075 [Rhizopus delemar]|uniref:Uncharacterized protein n=1 Tax=Rhizopus delemar TaxID=936053 RepID=A0A9P7BZB6_9FUNG|nr:hypothetical protein G6F50_018075 [Rhizopus delemar]